MSASAMTFAVLLPALLVAHNVADHWVQTDGQAQAKGLPGWVGRRACLAHVGTYTLTTAAVTALLWAVFALPITPAGFITGQVVSAVTHYIADRRTPLLVIGTALGKGGFFQLGAPRPGRDDNPSLGTGGYALDQAWHWGWLLAAALVTATAGALS